jgi:HSP20 family protein
MSKEQEGTQSDKNDQRLAKSENALPTTLELPLFSPFGFMRRLMEDLDRLGNGAASVWSPALEVFERDGKLVVRADVPGLEKDQINVEVLADRLIISGERTRESEEGREGLYRSERSYGSFSRVIALPEGVNPEKAVATFNNGVLEITMPAAKRSQPKRIEVREGSSGQGSAGEPPAQQAAAPH